MKENSQPIEITMNTAPEIFMQHLLTDVITPAKYNAWVDSDEIVQPYPPIEDVWAFLNCDYVTETIMSVWEYESDTSKWASRTAAKAVSETVGHALVSIRNDAFLAIERPPVSRENIFHERDTDGLSYQAIMDLSQAVIDFHKQDSMS